MDDNLQDLFDQMEDDTLPTREVLDRGEAVSEKLQAARHNWAAEIKGADIEQWSKKQLAEAVESARILKRVIMSNTPSAEKHKRTRSEDIRMEETLRAMGDETLARLRKLEKTGPEAEVLTEIVFKFFLSRKDQEIRAVDRGTSCIQKYLDIGSRLT